MKAKLLAGAAFGATLFLSMDAAPVAPTLQTAERVAPRLDPLDPLDPLSVARSLCGASGENRFRSSRAVFLRAASAYAQAAGLDGGAAPASPGLGNSALDIATDSADARARFTEGLRWAAGFNHGAAVQAFRDAQAADPQCAMCYWGEAWALGPNINAAMPPEAYAPAWAALQRAIALSSGASDLERALIEALSKRYVETPPDDRSDLDLAYAQAMNAVADRFPENDEVQAMAVEAGMDTQAWDYWQADQRTPKGFTAANLERLETVLARNPDHAPSIHLYIHSVEASTDPWRAEAAAGRLAGAAPAAGHLVHMPAHIYYRIGRFADSIETNLDAIVADEAYLEEAGEAADPFYRFGYYPHNVHFVLVSAQRAGDAATVEAFGPKLDAALPLEMTDAAPVLLPIKAAPILARAQYGDPAEILATPVPDGLAPYLQAAHIYARGEAAARLGRPAEARAEAGRLAEMKVAGALDDLPAQGVPGPELLEIMRLVVLGRAAMADQDASAAIGYFEEAAERQDALPYMEPPYWHYPARQSFAAALLLDGQAARAEQEFYRTLVQYPDNAWAYWGLAQARRARGDAAGADLAESQFGRAWLGGGDAISLQTL